MGRAWFALSSGGALASLLASAWWSKVALLLLSVDSLVLTLVVQLASFPRQGLERMRD